MKPSFGLRHIGPAVLAILGVVTVIAGCSKTPEVAPPPKERPETELTYAPVQYDTTTFRVHFYWNAYDGDGEVVRFHYAVDDDSLLPINQWKTTTAKDTTLLFQVDPVQELKVHVFKVSAEDNEGQVDLTPATRAFSAKTIPPTSRIEKGPSAFNPTIGPNFTFEWSGIDPDGGETGGKVPVDSFQYLLLRIQGLADPNTPPAPWHQPLPAWSNEDQYTDLINQAVGDTLPYPHGDWQWQGIRGLKFRFRNVTPGEYVFAERAVDIAGATEKNLQFVRNIRHFRSTPKNAGPRITLRASVFNRPLEPAQGPEDFARKQIQIFEGEIISFEWVGDASTYGGEVVGYTFALDDTSSLPGLDPRLTATTFRPDVLTPGPHVFYLRAVDDGGLVTNMVVPILIVHPEFRDPGATPFILFVDDSDGVLGNGSFPNDVTETDWWTLDVDPVLGGPLTNLVPFREWDTIFESQGSVEGRKQPTPYDLRDVTTIVWTTDYQNGGSIQTALFKSVAGGNYSEVQGYLRAGGTLILTGWNIAQNTTGGLGGNLTYRSKTPAGICAAFAPGSIEYQNTIFPRGFMGIDNSVENLEGTRSNGAFDFVRGIPTPFGRSLGFDTARVDTGSAANGGTYKWETDPYYANDNNGDGIRDGAPFPEIQLFPGLGVVEGWVMARDFGCIDLGFFGKESSGPIAIPVYTYHGVRKKPAQNGDPSPREGLVVGEFVQSHDLGNGDRTYHPEASIGRIAIFTFPLYFLRNADAISVMEKSYDFVRHSPTLP